jgi:hypothetical protein
VWIVAEAIKKDTDVSHFGAVIMPTVTAKDACKEGKLGNYFVQKKWNANKRSFDYRLGLDPTNSHCYSWWRTNLEDRNDIAKSLRLIYYNVNEGRWGDVVEAALGVLIIAERVPELEAYLALMFPSETRSWIILNSLSDSIRKFTGYLPGSKTKRKKESWPVINNFNWTVTFDEFYRTPDWEHQGQWARDAEVLTRRPDPSLGLEQLDKLLCVSNHGSPFIHCNCKLCIIMRKILSRTNPEIRSVMARTNGPDVPFVEEEWSQLREQVGKTYRVDQSAAPSAEAAPKARPSTPKAPPAAATAERAAAAAPSGHPLEYDPVESIGVRCSTFFSHLRGRCGEQKGDTKIGNDRGPAG